LPKADQASAAFCCRILFQFLAAVFWTNVSVDAGKFGNLVIFAEVRRAVKKAGKAYGFEGYIFAGAADTSSLQSAIHAPNNGPALW